MKFTRLVSGCIFIILFLLLGGWAWATTLTGKIVDKDDRPVMDALLTDGFSRAFSREDGTFSINAKGDSIHVSRLGYAPSTFAASELPHLIRLRERPVTLPTVRVVERFEPAFSSALDKTVISSDADSPAGDPGALLLNESALHSPSPRLIGEDLSISILGSLGRHTLVMLDNVPLNAPGKMVDLSLLPWGRIRRMEIVKGNASLYGGASAIGGIVYFFTDDVTPAQPLQLRVETALGSFGQKSGSLDFEQLSPQLAYRVNVTRQAADNDFTYRPRPWWPATGDLKRANNRKEQQGVSLALYSMLQEVGWQYRLDSETFYRQLPGPVNFPEIYKNAYLTGQNLRHNLSLSYKKNRLGDRLAAWLNGSETEYNNTRADNPAFPSRYRQKQSSSGCRNQLEYALETVSASFSAEFTRQAYSLDDLLYPNLSIGETARGQAAVSLQARLEKDFAFADNQLQAGIRIDNTEGFGSHTSWRVEDVLKLDGPFQAELGGNYGTGFSLPSFYDLYWKGDAQSLGNPDLEPETSRGGSIHLALSYRDYALQAAWHGKEVKNLIQWRQTYLYGPVWKPFNIGKARITNWEFTARAKPLTWLHCSSSLTLTRARDLALGADLTYTPRIRWTNQLDLAYRNLGLEIGLDHTGRQWSTPDNLIDPLPAVWLARCAWSWGFAVSRLKVNLRLDLNNLFDRQYEIYSYVPQPGFNWRSGLSLSYGI